MKTIILFTLIILTSSCWVDENGNLRFDSERNTDPIVTRERDTTQVMKSFDVVKNIKKEESYLTDTYWQSEYTINKKSHLLLNLKDILEHRDKILLSSENEEVYLDVKIKSEINENILQNLKVCRVLEDWSIYSDWQKRSLRRNWKKIGVTYSDCISGEAFEVIFKDEESRYHRAHHNDSEKRIVFNVKDFIRTDILESGENRGFILIHSSESDLKVYGDGDSGTGESGPRLYWKELRE